MLTIDQITAPESRYYFHHTAKRRGYVSRKTEGKVIKYSGRFGSGYAILRPRYDTTQYCTIEYWIRKPADHSGDSQRRFEREMQMLAAIRECRTFEEREAVTTAYNLGF